MKKAYKYFALIIVISLFACADLEEQPIGVLTPESFFNYEGDLVSTLLGLYNTPTGGSYYAGYQSIMLSDEFDVDPTTFRPYRFLFNEYRFTPSDVDTWNYFGSYTQIAHANIILSKIDGIELDDERKNAYRAEALFVRALNYFQLIRIFGDMPYLTQTMANPGDGASLERTPAEEIYESIIDDLKFGVDNLPDSYPGNVRNRATRGSALTVLSKIHLHLATYNQVYENAYEYRTIDKVLVESLKGDFSSHWEAAAEYALQVINNKNQFGYGLVENFQDLFDGEIGDTEEHIVSLDSYGLAKGGGYSGMTTDGWRNNNLSLGPYQKPWDVGGWGAFVPPMDLYNLFIDGDYRKEVSFETLFAITTAPVGGDTTSTIHYTALVESALKNPHAAKWTRYPGPCEQWPSAIASSYNIPIFRYGEVLLIAAEALNEMGRTEEAIALLNQLRERARTAGGENRDTPMNVATGISKEECWKVIWNERTYELAFEQKRWYDLVRRDSLIPVMSRFIPHKTGVPIGDNIKAHHILLPLPQSEMDLCPNLVQNKGY